GADQFENLRAIAAMLRLRGGEHGAELMQKHHPCRVCRLAGEIRMLARRALAPADQSLRVNFSQQHPSLFGGAKTGFKWPKQRNMKFAQNDSIDSHKICSPRRFPYRVLSFTNLLMVRVLPLIHIRAIYCYSPCSGSSSKIPLPSASRVKPITTSPRANASWNRQRFSSCTAR